MLPRCMSRGLRLNLDKIGAKQVPRSFVHHSLMNPRTDGHMSARFYLVGMGKNSVDVGFEMGFQTNLDMIRSVRNRWEGGPAPDKWDDVLSFKPRDARSTALQAQRPLWWRLGPLYEALLQVRPCPRAPCEAPPNSPDSCTACATRVRHGRNAPSVDRPLCPALYYTLVVPPALHRAAQAVGPPCSVERRPGRLDDASKWRGRAPPDAETFAEPAGGGGRTTRRPAAGGPTSRTSSRPPPTLRSRRGPRPARAWSDGERQGRQGRQ